MVADELRDVFEQVHVAYPRGVPADEYDALLVVLGTDMSDRGLAELLAEVLGKDPVDVAHDAASLGSLRPVPPRELRDRVYRRLRDAGWEPELPFGYGDPLW